MKHRQSLLLALLGVSTLSWTPCSEAQVTAGIDFDLASGAGATPPSTTYTESGFLSVPTTGAKSFNVTHNGITFDIQVTNANLGNQNRFRGGNTDTLNNLTPITVDFIQWYGRDQPGAVEATFTLTGLAANTDYELSFYTYNAGAGQTTHLFYEGASAATGTLLSSFTTAGNQNTPAAWVPNVNYTLNSGSNREIVVTVQGTTYVVAATGATESRLTFDGMSVTALGTPPAVDFAITNYSYSPEDNLVTLTWDSNEGEEYAVVYSKDLKDWSGDIDDSVVGDAGDLTTRSFDLVAAGLGGEDRIYFRVEKR